MLHTFYVKPYQVHGYNRLRILADLAEYYGALPILARTLDGAIRNEDLADDCHCNSVELLQLSRKLRDAVLFKECIITVVGAWYEGESFIHDIDLETLDPTLQKMVLRARHHIVSGEKKGFTILVNNPACHQLLYLTMTRKLWYILLQKCSYF